MSNSRFCVCVPARDEADRLPILLDAIASQTVEGPIPIALCVNNTTDDSVAVLERARIWWKGRLDLMITCHDLPPHRAHVGTARGIAMDAGLARVVPNRGILISTDADARPPVDWIMRIVEAIDLGADMVGGRIMLDEMEASDAKILAIRDKLDRYWACVRAIEDEIDPYAWDLAPRHGDHTGASLAITASLYRKIGGVPAIPSGEDRALVENGIAAGGRLRHPMTVWTRVSARTAGRASGGMADDMRALEDRIARGAPTLVPSFDQWRARALWRRGLRDRPGGAALIAVEERDLPPMACDMPLALDR